jgi:hypothetical protein
MKAQALLLIIIIMCLGVLAFAGIPPKTIHIQVRLSDDTAQQNPFEGAVSLIIRIYDAPMGGNLLWSTTLPTASFHKGIFEANLGGSRNSLPEIIFSKETHNYLEVEINGEVQNPRQLIIEATDPKKGEPPHDGAYLQSGAVAFFDLPQCPAGWSEFTQARGRFIVGLNPSGTSGATVGTALSDLENRPIGKHTHTINDPGHTHTCYHETGCHIVPASMQESTYSIDTLQTISINYTGITVLDEGSVAGTNSPYIQYLVCILN